MASDQVEIDAQPEVAPGRGGPSSGDGRRSRGRKTAKKGVIVLAALACALVAGLGWHCLDARHSESPHAIEIDGNAGTTSPQFALGLLTSDGFHTVSRVFHDA